MSDKEKLENSDISQATHRLRCYHVIRSNRQTYHMHCLPVKEMSGGRLKIIVFGCRFYRENGLDKKSIRYVDAYRVFPKG